MANEFNKRTFPSRNVTEAEHVACLFDDLFDPNWITTAVATCRFQFQGPKSVGATGKAKNWGEWIRTRIQTGGNPPNGFGPDRDFACQRQNNTWVSLDSREIVHLILDRVGLTIEDVYDQFGQPEQGQKYVVDLMTIIRRLTGLIPEQNVAAVA